MTAGTRCRAKRSQRLYVFTRYSPLCPYHRPAIGSRAGCGFCIGRGRGGHREGEGTVSATGDDREHTLTFADLALDKIKDLGQTADPRNYSAWFTYATNCNPSRNTIVN